MNYLIKKPLFIGLSGTLNAGKDSLAERLAEKHGFLHMSTSNMIRAMKKQQFGDSPLALLTRNDPYINKLRSERGPGFLVNEVHNLWEQNKAKYPGGFVASALRAIGEAAAIEQLGGIMIFVNADPKIRYARSQLRNRDATETGKTFEEFMKSERSEIDVDPSDKSVQNLVAMENMADLVVLNNGNNIEDFQDSAIDAIANFLH